MIRDRPTGMCVILTSWVRRIMRTAFIAVLALVLIGCAQRYPNPPTPDFASFPDVLEKALREEHLGKSKQELQAFFGAKVAGQVESDTWEIWDHLGPGAHSFVWVTQIKFQNDSAVEIKRHRKPVGCILVEPRREN